MERDGDAHLLVSMALDDADHHMLYSARSGYVNDSIRDFVSNHFQSSIDVYDDDEINLFFRSPSEKGFAALYQSAHSFSTIPPTFNTVMYQGETKNNELPKRKHALFHRYYAFGMPHITYAYNASIVVRRYALTFFHLVEQYSMGKTKGHYDAVLTECLDIYDADERKMTQQWSYDAALSAINEDVQPVDLLSEWIDTMRIFARNTVVRVEPLLIKRVNRLIDNAVGEDREELNQLWHVDVAKYRNRRLDASLREKIYVFVRSVATSFTVVDLLTPFNDAIERFIIYIRSANEDQVIDVQTYVRYLVLSGIFQSIHQVGSNASSPIPLSKVVDSFNQYIALLGQQPQLDFYIWRLRFLVEMIGVYRRVHCRVDDEKKTILFGPCNPCSYPLLRLATKNPNAIGVWTTANDVETVLYYSLLILTGVYDVPSVMTIPRIQLVRTVNLMGNTGNQSIIEEYAYHIELFLRPLPVVFVAESTPVIRTSPPKITPSSPPKKAIEPLPVYKRSDAIFLIQLTLEEGRYLSLLTEDGVKHTIHGTEFGILCSVALNLGNAPVSDKWLTDANIRHSFSLFAPGRGNRTFMMDGATMLSYYNRYLEGADLIEKLEESLIDPTGRQENKLILIPVIDGDREEKMSHWSTLLIYNDKAYHLDSSEGHNTAKAKAYYNMIRDNSLMPQRYKNSRTLDVIKVPRQVDGWSCGFYVVMIVKLIYEWLELDDNNDANNIKAFFAEEKTQASFETGNFMKLAYEMIMQIVTQGKDSETAQPVVVRPTVQKPVINDNDIMLVEKKDDTNRKTERSYKEQGIDLPGRQGFNSDQDYDNFILFLSRLGPVDRKLIEKELRLLGSESKILRDVYIKWFRNKTMPDKVSLIAMKDEIYVLCLQKKLELRSLNLSSAFILMAMRLDARIGSKTVVFDYLFNIDIATGKTLHDIANLYGEWPLYPLIRTQVRAPTPSHKWRGHIRYPLIKRLEQSGAEQGDCLVLIPEAMRYLVCLRRESEYLYDDKHPKLDSLKLHNMKESFHASVDRDEEARIMDNYTPENAKAFFDVYKNGYFIANGTYGFTVLYRFDARPNNVIVKFQTNKPQNTHRLPDLTKEIGAIIERKFMISIRDGWIGNRDDDNTPNVEEFHHHIKILDYTKCRLNVKNLVYDKLYNKDSDDTKRYYAELQKKHSVMWTEPFMERDMDMMIMEFVPNGSLANFIAYNHSDVNEPFNMSLFLSCIIQISGYLHAIYKNLFIVHNDVTPNNILISRVRNKAIRYLTYRIDDKDTRFVIPNPGFLCKVADFGKAQMGGEMTPCFDVENLILSYLWFVMFKLMDARKDAFTYLCENPTFVSFVLRQLRTVKEARHDYRAPELYVTPKNPREIAADEDTRNRYIAFYCYSVIIDAFTYMVQLKNNVNATKPYVFTNTIMIDNLIEYGIIKAGPVLEAMVLYNCIEYVYQKNHLWIDITPVPDYHINSYTRLFASIRKALPGIVFDDAFKKENNVKDDEVVFMNNYGYITPDSLWS